MDKFQSTMLREKKKKVAEELDNVIYMKFKILYGNRSQKNGYFQRE